MSSYADVVRSQGMNRDVLDTQPNLFVKQTRKGWVQECFGCDANTEFKIATMQDQQQDIMYAIENTSCCVRLFCGSNRPFTITASEGGVSGGKTHSFHERALACPLMNLKCCCFQRLEAKDHNGIFLGAVEETCWMCVPTFQVVKQDLEVQYHIHQPTCCGGMCVDLCSEGCCSCRIPFHVYAPGREEKGQELGSVTKIWSGMKKEITSDADNFELQFPADADTTTKTRLLGATFLINQIFFENKN